jgi:VanZ family protein
MPRGRNSWIVLSVWAAVIFAVSSIPSKSMPHVAFLRHDKILHAVLYMPLGALLLTAIRAKLSARPLALIGLAGLLAGLYGVTDELHQLLVPGRACELFDMLADLVGGTVGAAIASAALAPTRAARQG